MSHLEFYVCLSVAPFLFPFVSLHDHGPNHPLRGLKRPLLAREQASLSHTRTRATHIDTSSRLNHTSTCTTHAGLIQTYTRTHMHDTGIYTRDRQAAHFFLTLRMRAIFWLPHRGLCHLPLTSCGLNTRGALATSFMRHVGIAAKRVERSRNRLCVTCPLAQHLISLSLCIVGWGCHAESTSAAG
jgi:hypothetical protein